MSLIVESIRIENKQLQNIDLHNERFQKARKSMFNESAFINIEEHVKIPAGITNTRYKCRVTYDGNSLLYTIKPYYQRTVKTLRIVHINHIDYSTKTDNREQLDKAFALRNGCDDVIIVKNRYLTDAWASNIILFNGNEWHTPSTPLLRGTQREYLIRSQQISVKNITEQDLWKYSKIKLINAMIDFNRAPDIEISTGVFNEDKTIS
ncbi:MAG: aminotransferase class IV [Prolixibacteraceae bacterium]|jgi:4-amino-4-deoxychorismate lyase|nr:aminotransferase class IV [Prolixibacteraceae bacterium]